MGRLLSVAGFTAEGSVSENVLLVHPRQHSVTGHERLRLFFSFLSTRTAGRPQSLRYTCGKERSRPANTIGFGFYFRFCRRGACADAVMDKIHSAVNKLKLNRIGRNWLCL